MNWWTSASPGTARTWSGCARTRILIDGAVGEEGLLLQIFTENLFGPIFFEIIQRKGNEGFGGRQLPGPVREHRTRPDPSRGD